MNVIDEWHFKAVRFQAIAEHAVMTVQAFSAGRDTCAIFASMRRNERSMINQDRAEPSSRLAQETEPIGDDRQHRSDHFRHADCAEYDAPGLAFFATSEPTRRCIKKCLRLRHGSVSGFKEFDVIPNH